MTHRKIEPEDDREVARIWTGYIDIAMRYFLKTDHRGADLDLGFIINEAHILRAMMLIACKDAGYSEDDISNLRKEVSESFDGMMTKKAKAYFHKKRKRIEKIDQDILGDASKTL